MISEINLIEATHIKTLAINYNAALVFIKNCFHGCLNNPGKYFTVHGA